MEKGVSRGAPASWTRGAAGGASPQLLLSWGLNDTDTVASRMPLRALLARMAPLTPTDAATCGDGAALEAEPRVGPRAIARSRRGR